MNEFISGQQRCTVPHWIHSVFCSLLTIQPYIYLNKKFHYFRVHVWNDGWKWDPFWNDYNKIWITLKVLKHLYRTRKKLFHLFCKCNAAPHAKGCCTLHYYLQYIFVLSWENPKKSPHVFDIIALFTVQLCDCNYNSTLKSTVPKTEYLST